MTLEALIMQTRLLIISCSSKKRSDVRKIPALQRYDGPTFKVLKKYLRDGKQESQLDIYILSAEYGLINQHMEIPNYDRTFTTERAEELQPTITQSLKQIPIDKYDTVCISLSNLYRSSLPDLEAIWNLSQLELTDIQASQGRRLTLLKQWLWNDTFIRNQKANTRRGTPNGRAILKGTELRHEIMEIEEIVEDHLEAESTAAFNFRKWYVDILGERISPKWIVSKIANLPLSEFTTGEARRVLHHLHIKCHQVNEEI